MKQVYSGWWPPPTCEIAHPSTTFFSCLFLLLERCYVLIQDNLIRESLNLLLKLAFNENRASSLFLNWALILWGAR